MTRLMTLMAIGAMASAALAVPLEGTGESSYTFQGPPIKVRVSNRRSIPAPSQWTPPERVPSARVNYVRRDQPKRLGGGFNFTSPSFSNPALSSPNFSSPAFTSPSLSNPAFTNPSYTNPALTNPALTNPALTNPAFSNPTFSNPAPR